MHTFYTVDTRTNLIVMASDGPNKCTDPALKTVELDPEEAELLWTEYSAAEGTKILCACSGLSPHCHDKI